MDFDQLRAFVAVADELHFGRAARRLDMHPAALGRHVRLLEESLATQLLFRTTRNVSLTPAGAELREEAGDLLARIQALTSRFRDASSEKATRLTIGVIDTAAAGLVPSLLQDFRERHPEISVQVVEDKSIRLLPRLLSGRLSLALVRPPEHRGREIEFRPLLEETAVVAVAASHRFARRRQLAIEDLADEPVIVPDRRSRPHSHALTMTLFERAGVRPAVAQLADEKQTIINLVAAGLGIAIVPRWAAKMATDGVKYIAIDPRSSGGPGVLPLAAAYVRGTQDPARDALLSVLMDNLDRYRQGA